MTALESALRQVGTTLTGAVRSRNEMVPLVQSSSRVCCNSANLAESVPRASKPARDRRDLQRRDSWLDGVRRYHAADQKSTQNLVS